MDYIEQLIAIVKTNLEKTGQENCYSQKSKYGYTYYGLNAQQLDNPQVKPLSAYLDAIRYNFEYQTDEYYFLGVDKEDILFEILKLKPDGETFGKMLCYFFDAQEGRRLYCLPWMDNQNPEHRQAALYMIAHTHENAVAFNETPIFLTTKFKHINDYFNFNLDELKKAFTPYFQNNTLITEEVASFFLARCIKKEEHEAIRSIIPQLQEELSLFQSNPEISYLVLKKNYLVLNYSGLIVDFVERDKNKDSIYMLLDFIGKQINEHHYFDIDKILINQQWNDYLITVSSNNSNAIEVFKKFIHQTLQFCEHVTEKNFTHLDMHVATQNEIKTFMNYWITNYKVETNLEQMGIDIYQEQGRSFSLKI